MDAYQEVSELQSTRRLAWRKTHCFALQSISYSWHTADNTNDEISTSFPSTVAPGRLGGLKGVPVLAVKMTPAKREAAARKSALTRW